jgi:branched-chain amino acid transport system permease protein
MAISFIAFFYALPFLNNPLINTPGSDFQSVLFYPVGMYVLMAIGLNIVVGKSGLLDLGYVAFFAIGAYTMAILGTKTSLNFWQILPCFLEFCWAHQHFDYVVTIWRSLLWASAKSFESLP